MYKLTFDIGTKNLAYSLGHFDCNEKKINIVFGKTIDLDDYGKMLDEYDNTNSENPKSKIRSNKKYTQIEKVHIVNGILIDLINKKTIEKHGIKKLDKVYIERQCSFGQKLVFSISYIVYSFFTQLKHNPLVHDIEIGQVKMVSGAIKMVANSWNQMNKPTKEYLKFVKDLFQLKDEQVEKEIKKKRHGYIYKIYFEAICPSKQEFEDFYSEKIEEIKGLYGPQILLSQKDDSNVKKENNAKIKKTTKTKSKLSKILKKKLADLNHVKNKRLSIRLCVVCLYYLNEGGFLQEDVWRKLKSAIQKQLDKLDDYCDTLNYVFETDLELILGKNTINI